MLELVVLFARLPTPNFTRLNAHFDVLDVFKDVFDLCELDLYRLHVHLLDHNLGFSEHLDDILLLAVDEQVCRLAHGEDIVCELVLEVLEVDLEGLAPVDEVALVEADELADQVLGHWQQRRQERQLHRLRRLDLLLSLHFLLRAVSREQAVCEREVSAHLQHLREVVVYWF